MKVGSLSKKKNESGVVAERTLKMVHVGCGQSLTRVDTSLSTTFRVLYTKLIRLCVHNNTYSL